MLFVPSFTRLALQLGTHSQPILSPTLAPSFQRHHRTSPPRHMVALGCPRRAPTASDTCFSFQVSPALLYNWVPTVDQSYHQLLPLCSSVTRGRRHLVTWSHLGVPAEHLQHLTHAFRSKFHPPCSTTAYPQSTSPITNSCPFVRASLEDVATSSHGRTWVSPQSTYSV